MARIALEAVDLGKRYKIYGHPAGRILEALTGGRRAFHRDHWALRGVNLRLPRGVCLGVVGANGAGKSTLLRLLTGVTAPTSGFYRIEGSVGSLLELGAGFHPAFSGRDNARMNASILGFSRAEIEARLPSIEAFAELGEFFDRPVRTYSSGMGMRLAFSVAAAVEPDMLLVDEVFAVGDMHFQSKCVEKIFEMKRRGCTILFCSHSLYDIRQLCDEAIWLREGRVVEHADAVTVTNAYAAFERSLDRFAVEKVLGKIPQAEGEGVRPRIADARVCRVGTEEEADRVSPGEGIEVRVWYRNPDPARTPIHVGVGFFRNDSTLCCADTTEFARLEVPGRAGCVVHRVPRVALLSGTFQVFAILFDVRAVHRYDQFICRRPLVVLNRGKDVGLFLQDHEWEVRPGEEAPAAPAAPSAEAGARARP
ncbi:MAG TPA: ABC transporter ATP-binding protein [Planctomycetota bacterium]|jgi:lipopolysaccharide transport system ATP-binding protein|nr:ABC transporter ATP-binding protein [Planctomycetota bacterium]